MNLFRNDHEMQTQNTGRGIQLAEDTCHIKPDTENLALFDIESVWCSFCQRPRFDDGLSTELCICVSFTSTNNTWLPQAVDSSAFQSLQPRHYDAVDSWLHGSVDVHACVSSQTSAFDAMTGISPIATSLGLYSLSTSGEDVSSPATSITPMTRGSSVTSTSSRTPSRERESERSSLEMNNSDSSEFRRMLSAKQRRREQNRNSQHRFRERRNQVTKDLQDKVDSLTKINEILNKEIAALRKKLGGASEGSEGIVGGV
ncbi:hypothetical protein ONS95_008984 [Cadophora gregata]|uniref:uncharacterized protein n=1 Tax=Cadophora gregata TaxID=51156 RepID=UPI0026DD1262|nr:uncharacterized protein ONS95_008984 [Cadophora gregata]KAK0123995.1 hypothetical protein ONS95_008984 [Cadophora gregata]KAK0130334.1 hypothetical protein ONS96_000856 [Cadophora gregata f. sp. sojae]